MLDGTSEEEAIIRLRNENEALLARVKSLEKVLEKAVDRLESRADAAEHCLIMLSRHIDQINERVGGNT